MKYTGYEAIVEYNNDDSIFVGRVLNTRDVIAFGGMTVTELAESFSGVIDEYLGDCPAINKDPDKPYSGEFLLSCIGKWPHEPNEKVEV